MPGPGAQAEPLSARLQALVPKGVTASLEGCHAQFLVTMIGALGRGNVPPVG